ncbi:MAG: GDP-mannose 4,6-dehydratase, partial [Clostridiales bacterium]|nr:GDP-mannose 4,6-dehydratase [Clostridiales bacterium]
MKALITGISGFVGGYLGELLLNENFEVHGSCYGDSANVSPENGFILHELNLTDKGDVSNLLKSLKPDYIYALAAQSSTSLSWKQPDLTFDINIKGASYLLEAVREHVPECKLLLVGSSEEYGIIEDGFLSVDEKHELKPANPYAVSKIAQSMLGQIYAKAYGLNIVISRAFNHIGPKQGEKFVVSEFAKRIAEIEKGADPVMYVGNLDAKRDFTDVRDIVKAYRLLIENGISGEIYNVGSGKTYSINQILEILLTFTDKKIEVIRDSGKMRPIDTPAVYC